MDRRLITTLLVAIGIATASCSGATAIDAPIDEVVETTSTATSVPPTPETTSTSASAPGAPAVGVDVEIRMRRDVRSSNASSESAQMATIRMPDGLDVSSPVVVLLHGAGGPTRESLQAMAEAVADLGVPVLNASWAASPAHPREAAADAVCAVAYAYEQAASWGANPDRVIVMGHSGGGHVGMLAALAPAVFPECPTASDAHVWAYIGLAGDPTAAAPGGNLYPFLKDYPEILAVMDATNHIGGNPDLIARFIHGTADGTVKIERTVAFSQALIDAGYDSLHISVEGGGHGDPASPTTDAGVAALRAVQELVDLSLD